MENGGSSITVMKGIWIGNDDELALRKGKEYEILGIDEDFDAYVVMDETEDTYLYPMEGFEITEEFPLPPKV